MYYTVFRHADRTEWAILSIPSHNMNVVNLFTKPQTAERYIQLMKLGADWEVGEIGEDDIASWLKQSRERGASHVETDCDPASREHRMNTIQDLLDKLKDERDGRCSRCARTCRAIGNQLEPNQLPVFDRATFYRTAIWCPTCREVFCGQCQGESIAGPGLGTCKTCGSQVDFARVEHWSHSA